MEAGVGQHDALVGQRRLGEDAGVLAAGERALERADVVEADHVDVAVGGRCEPEVREPPVAGERGEHLVAVAAVVAGEGEHLAPAGRVAGQPERLGVGLRGRQRELPGGQAPAARELVGHDDGVLGRQHELGAGGHAPLHGAHDRLRVDAAEGALVADVGVQEAAPVGAGEVGAVPLVDPHRRVGEVARHPAHGHAVRHALAGALAQLQAARMLARIARALALPQLVDARGIDSGSSVHPADYSSRVRRARIRLPRASCSTSARPSASSTGGT